MNINSSWQWIGLSAIATGLSSIIYPSNVLAQIVPDDTLGEENSIVNPRDETSDSIDGGAIRGQNLFHSFQEFNVGEGRGQEKCVTYQKITIAVGNQATQLSNLKEFIV